MIQKCAARFTLCNLLPKLPCVATAVAARQTVGAVFGQETGTLDYVDAVEIGLERCANRLSGWNELLDGGGGGKGGKGDGICGLNSFVGETRVLLGDGRSERIDRVRVGDRVWAADPETGERSIKPVTDVIVGDGWKRLTKLTLATAMGLVAIVATAGHPVWSETDDAWVAAAEVEAGDRLEGADGGDVAVAAVEQEETVRRVYNLTVEGLHTFFVVAGDEAVLVHNAGGTCDPSDVIEKGRVDRVKSLFPGSDIQEEILVYGGGTGIRVDLVVDSQLFIEVGGGGKALNMGKFGSQLGRLKAVAVANGGTPMFYYETGTSQQVIDLATKILGPQNVKGFT